MVDNRGTSRAYAMRRLKHERVDLLERVRSGELSPHAAMVQAGIRPARFTVVATSDPEKIADVMRRHLPEAVLSAVADLLRPSGGHRSPPAATKFPTL
jgi:hypothetical protein